MDSGNFGVILGFWGFSCHRRRRDKGGRKEEGGRREEGEARSRSLKSNNPTLKGGEKYFVLVQEGIFSGFETSKRNSRPRATFW